jgi:outer membrane protein OmpA-like peptidoglycan-associated protein
MGIGGVKQVVEDKTDRSNTTEIWVERGIAYFVGVLTVLVPSVIKSSWDAYVSRAQDRPKEDTVMTLDYLTDRKVGGVAPRTDLPNLMGSAQDEFVGRMSGDKRTKTQNVIHLSGVYFEYQSDVIHQWTEPYQTVKKLAEAFKQGGLCPVGARLMVIGHADPKEFDNNKKVVPIERLDAAMVTYQSTGLSSSGKELRLQALSLARAVTAQNLLKDFGVSNVRTRGDGANYPLVRNDKGAKEGARENRRVEFVCAN